MQRPEQGLRDPERVLGKLDWTVLRRLDGLLQGDYRTLFHGLGLDLAELREYQLTDDVRYIDWNVTARLQEPYVRQYREDREVTAWFLLDMSPSVDFGTGQALKRDTLIEFVGVLARLLTRRGNRVGAILYTGQVDKIVPAGTGRLHVLRLLRAAMEHPRLRRSNPTDLRTLIDKGRGVAPRRSLFFVVSDFLSAPGWEKSLAELSLRHETMAVRLIDPLEMELPNVGLVYFEDAESGEQLLIDTNDAAFRRRFMQGAARKQAQLEASLAKSGVPVLELSTRGDMVKEIIRYASLQKRAKAAQPAKAA